MGCICNRNNQRVGGAYATGVSMKRLILGIVPALVAASPVLAADLLPPTSNSADWTGIYVGVHGGFGGDTFEYPMTYDDGDNLGGFTIDASADITSSGFFGGGQAGYNWQLGPNFLVGVEGDISWSDIKGELGLRASIDPDVANLRATAGSEVEWFGTGRARVGFLPTASTLVYATGGVAFGEVKSSYDIDLSAGGFPIFALSDSTSETQVGWTAGAGVEFAITDHLRFKTEYLYVDLGDETLYDGPLIAADDDLSIKVDTHFHTIKAGLNYRF